MISPCFDKKLVEVLVSVAMCTAVLHVAPYLRVFRLQRKASYTLIIFYSCLDIVKNIP